MVKRLTASDLNIRLIQLYFKAFLFVCLFLFSCKNKSEEIFGKLEEGSIKPSGIIINYPLEGTIFPPEFPAPEFIWKDSNSGKATYYISVLNNKKEKLFTCTVDSLFWRPDAGDWENIKKQSDNEKINIIIVGEHRGITKKISSAISCFSISADSVGASVFYRGVPLPFGYAIQHFNEIEWYLCNVNGEKPKKVLENMPVCANCHSFTKEGTKLAMDIDYGNDKGSYIETPIEDTIKLTHDKIISWSDYKREDREQTYGLLSQISPDGKYVLSTVKDLSVFIPVDNLEYSQLFFPVKGILVYYDFEKRAFNELRGANDRSLVQSNPCWSPDGEKVVFTRAKSYFSPALANSHGVTSRKEDVIEFLNGEKDFKFDLYQVDFNNGNGGEPVAVQGASHNHLSNYFARFSPNGKWIVFCQAENFMLLQPDSKMYIMPANGGVPRLMNCNTGNMNSWHSWSPNSKWIVFSSKKKGAYTQLYLTYVDESGNDSPPVFLENMAFEKKAANIPEFVKNCKPFDLIIDSFSKSSLYYDTNSSKVDLERIAESLTDKKKTSGLTYQEERYLGILLNQLKEMEEKQKSQN
ncbi:MAG: PD40 domain-containing protein [Prolixibacteraceae bacterium]|nr:PD40 domain-containing protein [Prolixibacteraceae bacterium]